MVVDRDTLYLLKPGFADPAYPGQRFYCWHCAAVEGVLANHPDLASRLCVERIDWPRPRRELAERVGEKIQDMPMLVLTGSTPAHPRFITGVEAVLAALSDRYGVERAHP